MNTTRKIIYTLFLLFGLSWSASAETQWDFIQRRNEIRLGWGDQIFESLMWHNPTSVTTTLPASMEFTYKENYRHNQHIWVEYQWRFNEWFSLGGMMDMSEVGWNVVKRNGAGQELERSDSKYFYNLVFMPTVRFTYFHHPYVNIYSGLGLGLDINGGTELNAMGKNTEVGAAVNVTVIGVSANYERWFMALDLGGLTALQNKNSIYMVASRMISFSIGARF